MRQQIINYWRGLQPRERLILGGGSIFVLALLFHQMIWQPWQNAISYMESSLVQHRTNLAWMQQQASLLETGGSAPQAKSIKGRDQSLMSVIEQTARATGVRDAIQQLTPREGNTQVSVTLEGASFNRWVQWSDLLQSQYGVKISQLSAEREDKPDSAEIRVTFSRS